MVGGAGRLVRRGRAVPPPARAFPSPTPRSSRSARPSSARPWASSSTTASSRPTRWPSGSAPPASGTRIATLAGRARQRRQAGRPHAGRRRRGRRPPRGRRRPRRAGAAAAGAHRGGLHHPDGGPGPRRAHPGGTPRRGRRRRRCRASTATSTSTGPSSGTASATRRRGGCPVRWRIASSSACSTGCGRSSTTWPTTTATACGSQLDARILRFVDELQTSPELRARGEQLTRDLLERPELRGWVTAVWADAKAHLRAQAADPSSELHAQLARRDRRRRPPAAGGAGPRRQGRRRRRGGARGTSSSTSAARSPTWSARRSPAGTARRPPHRLELLLGPDLQFIRINGTVVGGIAGLALHAIAQLLGLTRRAGTVGP